MSFLAGAVEPLNILMLRASAVNAVIMQYLNVASAKRNEVAGMTDRPKLPVEAVILTVAICPNQQSVETILSMILQDARYSDAEYRQVAAFAEQMGMQR